MNNLQNISNNTPKRKKSELTIEQKREMCLYWREHRVSKSSRLTQDHLRNHFSKQFQISIPKSTIIDIFKSSDRYINFDTTDIPNKMRIRGARYPELEEALYLWFSEMRAFKAPVNDQMLILKAQYYSQMLINCEGKPIIDPKFKFSGSLIEGFRERHHINFKTLHGEGASFNLDEINKFRMELKEITRHYQPKDIYNADEYVLFYKLLPNRTLANKNDKDERGTKTNIERITAMVCCNADGSNKMKLLVIHKCRNPRTRFDPNPLVDYHFIEYSGLNE